MAESDHLLDLQHLKTYFYTFEGVARAVDDVSFFLDPGEVLGIVGESGCGKSVTAQSIMRLIPQPPGKIVEGRILFDGRDLVRLSMGEMRGIRGNRIAMIFQEPMTSLNPVYTIGNQISEMFRLHMGLGRREGLNRAVEMLKKVQIPAPEKRVGEYPHQLSGGMRQRAMIAMALACDPEILIADEPTTALDVTVQAQILDLMLKLKEDFDTAIMMITHDLGVIAEIARRVVVMYAGRIVEEAETVPLFEDPKHPYTQGLLRSIPKLGRRGAGERTRLVEIKGIVPGLLDLPEGCRFSPRCPQVMGICRKKDPPLGRIGPGRTVRCWLYFDEPGKD
ncbi:MAG: ABC transporter ATP-binding protein [Desulfobacterales bacterium]|nr:ABC transporter ATP-binding protein [Desulfobacterales bacterium]MCF8080899.1 ABC transporter ATP-binding protein [Desulfobacterales bacterium]